MPPQQLQQLLQQAVAHHQAGRLAQAEVIYRRLRGTAPRNFDVLHLSGVIALQEGRTPESLDLLAKAHAVNPRHAVCAMRLGLAHITAGNTAEAEAKLRLALQLDPQLPEAWDNLAYCYKTQDRLKEAIECHQRVASIKPEYAVGWYNYGLTLSLYGYSAEALKCHERALSVEPGYKMGYYGRAQALQQMHQPAEAITAYDRFLALEPKHHEARSYRLFAMNYLADLTREQVFAEHVDFGRKVGTKPVPDFPQSADPARRLRVAVLSPDLRAHSCAYFIEPLLRHLDPAQFELYLYHDHFREDAVSERLKTIATVWRRFVGQSEVALMRTVREDRPDILIDLAGHTGVTNRLPLYAHHLAPVQITYLGYPNTTGLPAMGYRFTDNIADPAPEADAFATEKLVRFSSVAWAYQPPADAPGVAPVPCAGGKPVTFGCYNNLGKITDAMLTLWGRLLATVPGSRLVLKGRGLGDEESQAAYHVRFTACGLPPERVDLLERTPGTSDHLALYHAVDISLDTFPYHGTTTTCEALWMGVPVVTLGGDRHVARVSASLLTAAGHPEWIARTADEYIRIAAALASDPVKLSAIRAHLRDEMCRSALLDHAGQSARFGAALRQCWQSYCSTHAQHRAA